MTGGPIVFLIDVDNTLLDNDEIPERDLMSYDLPAVLTGGRPITFSAEVTR